MQTKEQQNVKDIIKIIFSSNFPGPSVYLS